LDTPKGDVQLLTAAMDAMNAKSDDGAKERTGCSGHVGKMIFSAGEDQVAIVAYVPKDKEPKVDVADWTKFVLESVGGTVMCSPGVPANSPCGGTMVQVIIRADPKEEHDPLKDLAVGMEAANAYLRERGAVPEHVQ